MIWPFAIIMLLGCALVGALHGNALCEGPVGIRGACWRAVLMGLATVLVMLGAMHIGAAS